MGYWENMLKKHEDSYDYKDGIIVPNGISYAEKPSLFGRKTKGVIVVFKDENEKEKKRRK